MRDIPVFKPLIEEEEIQSAVSSLEQGWLGMGSSVGKFEKAIKDFLGCHDRHVVAVSTGHAALHLGMIIAGVKPGDEVITPAFNNIADFQAILAVGAHPVLCDIDEETLCIDVKKAESLITRKTKAIVVMDYDCCLVDHESIMNLKEKYNIRVIHDAAHSLGSHYKGKKIGTFSDICMFSFDPVKTITCIDGGVLVVKTEKEVEALHQMRLLGMGQPSQVMYRNQRAWTYDVSSIGFRYHMANLHAEIGLSQIQKLPRITESRQHSCRLYNELLSKVPSLITPKSDFNFITPFLYYIRVPSSQRQDLRDWLKDNGIDTGIHWQPGHWFSLLKECRAGDLSVTDKIGHEILSLPLHSMMCDSDIEYICKKIHSFFFQGDVNG